MIRNTARPRGQIRRAARVQRVDVFPGGVHEVRGEILERVHESGELAPGRFVEPPGARLFRHAEPVSDGGERRAAERALVGRDAARQKFRQIRDIFTFERERDMFTSFGHACRSGLAEKHLASRI
jgi:hypothetical protein